MISRFEVHGWGGRLTEGKKKSYSTSQGTQRAFSPLFDTARRNSRIDFSVFVTLDAIATQNNTEERGEKKEACLVIFPNSRSPPLALLTHPPARRSSSLVRSLARLSSMATTAEEGDKREPPGLGPRTRRSAATRETSDMAGGYGEEEGALCYVLSLPAAALPLPVAVSCLDATVPRKERSRVRLRSPPSGWWAFRLPAPAPEAARNPSEEEARDPRPPCPRVRTAPPGSGAYTPAPAQEERPAKRARMCLQCGAAETPRWRSGPMGQGTLCNACGVRLRAAGALREQVHRPPPATARTVAEPPPESPVSESSPGSPIWQPGSVPDVYLMRKKPMKRGAPRPPRTRAEPAPAAALPVYLVRKKKKKKKKSKASGKKPWRPRDSAKRCLHCGSSSTPQWREGPMGRSTLCNACGVRYRQGRLLPEYRPMASPTFEPSEHASRHSQVLQLHRQRKSKDHQHPPPMEEKPQPVYDSAATAADDELPRRWVKNEYPPTPLHQPLPHPVDSDLRVGSTDDAAAGGRADAPSSLDSLLLDGPSAPLIVDGDESSIV
ncbi:hypothetical protein BS78_08G039500 [Paspalum vaginatum]|nr:hypothetical protein BS78_08G039500 [Paspalum vaginatum]